MKESKKPNEEEIQKFFEEKVNQSGYTLQTEVAKKLSSKFRLSREVHYVDKDGAKGRPIDLIARTFYPKESILKEKRKRYILSQLELVIECKQLPNHAWVFFPSEPIPFAFVESVSFTDSINPDPINPYLPYFNTRMNIPYAEGYAEFFLPDKKGSNGKEGNLYEAVMAVTKATRYEIGKMENLIKELTKAYPPKLNPTRVLMFTLFQPLIVFKGRMYEANLEGDKLKLKSIKYAQIPKNYVSEKYDESVGEIHIVTFEALDEYLQLLDVRHSVNTEKMINDQEKLLQIIDKL